MNIIVVVIQSRSAAGFAFGRPEGQFHADHRSILPGFPQPDVLTKRSLSRRHSASSHRVPNCLYTCSVMVHLSVRHTPHIHLIILISTLFIFESRSSLTAHVSHLCTKHLLRLALQLQSCCYLDVSPNWMHTRCHCVRVTPPVQDATCRHPFTPLHIMWSHFICDVHQSDLATSRIHLCFKLPMDTHPTLILLLYHLS